MAPTRGGSGDQRVQRNWPRSTGQPSASLLSRGDRPPMPGRRYARRSRPPRPIPQIWPPASRGRASVVMDQAAVNQAAAGLAHGAGSPVRALSCAATRQRKHAHVVRDAAKEPRDLVVPAALACPPRTCWRGSGWSASYNSFRRASSLPCSSKGRRRIMSCSRRSGPAPARASQRRDARLDVGQAERDEAAIWFRPATSSPSG